MVKQRLTTADVAGEVSCLRHKLLDMRVSNVYDVNPKTYLIKFARSGEDGEKVFLVVENGIRFHTTQLIPDKSDTPSNFTLKLRKHIRGRRLVDITQLGVDRVVDLTFGTGEVCHHLILEFYAAGNVVLTDSSYNVLTLLRSHRDDDKGVAIMARHPYPIKSIRYHQPVNPDRLTAAIQKCTEQGKTKLKDVVGSLLEYGPAIGDHCILTSGLHLSRDVSAQPLSEEDTQKLLTGVSHWEQWLVDRETTPPKGYIALKREGKKGPPQVNGAEAKDGSVEDGIRVVFDDFAPLVLQQHASKEWMEFETFDAALEEFFGKVDSQKAETARLHQESAVVNKLDKVKADHARRLETLQKEADSAERKAQLIEYNQAAVDAAINAVREALANGMSWRDLGRMVKEEKRAGNPVASLIDSMQLERNCITLLLSNYLDEEEGEGEWDEEANTMPATKVEVDIGLGAYANACNLYDQRKKHSAKHQKTLNANEKALKAAKKKAEQQIKQGRTIAAVQSVRKPLWFEKFHWFVSSENYLVISGRDAQQNELLVKRYLRRGDVYVHAELYGASSTIIKNTDPDAAIPPLTLSQAGCACVCRSAAWDAKVVTSAWWVPHNQVSKTAPSGEYLPTGSFMIRGKKNFLPPQPLVMGFTFLFKLDESCIADHVGERAVRGAGGAEEGEGVGGQMAGMALQDGTDDDEEAGPSAPSIGGSTLGSALDDFLDSSVDPLLDRNRRLTGGGVIQSYQRYGLQYEEASGQVPEDGTDAGSTPVRGPTVPGSTQEANRKHLSAKEKRVAKKVADSSSNATRAGEPALQHKQNSAEQGNKQHQNQAQQQQQQQQAPRRGKNAKLKKLKEKYADQDEEDRQLALMVLGSAGTKKDKKARQAARKARKESHVSSVSEAALATEEDIARVRVPISATVQHTQQQHSQGDIIKQELQSGEDVVQDENSSDDNDDGGVDRSLTAGPTDTTQHQDQGAATPSPDGDSDSAESESETATGNDDPALDSTVVEDGSGDPEEGTMGAPLDDDKTKLTEVDALTGRPKTEDVLLHAVPMCAPYTAIMNYKFKVKLVPGTQRKGKAARQIVELLSRGPDVLPREKELMKAVPDMESINCMVGNVKVSMPGLQKIKNDQRQNKKKGKGNK